MAAQAVLTQAQRDACLAALKTELSTTARLHLFTGSPQLGPNMAIEDFTEPTFTGGAPKAVANWTDPYTNPSGQRVISGDNNAWICTGGTPDDVVTGWFVTDTMDMDLYSAAYLPAPIAISAVGQGFDLAPEIQYGA